VVTPMGLEPMFPA